MQRDHNAVVSTGVQNCAKGTHREAPTASIRGRDDASVFGPNDADRRGAPVLWDTRITNEPLQFEATTITRAQHFRVSCMAIRIRELPAFFGISKPIAWRMTTAFAGTPSFTAASQSRTVEPSTAVAAANHKPS